MNIFTLVADGLSIAIQAVKGALEVFGDFLGIPEESIIFTGLAVIGLFGLTTLRKHH